MGKYYNADSGANTDNGAKCRLSDTDCRNFVDNEYQLLCVINSEGTILRLNKAWKNLLGFDCSTLKGTSLFDLTHAGDVNTVEERCRTLLKSKETEVTSFRIKDTHDNYQKIHWTISPVKNNLYLTGRECLTMAYDAQSFQREELLEKTGELARFGIWEYNCIKKTLYWSKQTKSIHEVEEDYTPTIEQALQFYADENSRAVIEKAFKEAMNRGKSYDHQLKIRTAKGNEKWVRTWGKPIVEEGECINVAGTIQDITKEKNNELELKHQKNRLAKIIEAAKLGTWEYNLQTGENRWNERWAEIIGYTLDELDDPTIDTFFNFVHPRDTKRVKDKLDGYLKGEYDSYQAEFRMRHKQGHWVWVHDSGEIISRTQEGEPEIMYGIHLDITEQKSVQKKLEQSEKSFRSNFENAGIGMAIVDKSGTWIKTNQQLQDMLGYSHEELRSQSFFDITHPDDIELTRKQNSKLFRRETDKINFKKRYIHKNSGVVHVEVFASAIRKDGEIDYIISQIIDITKEVKLTNELQNTVANLQAIMDASSEVAIIGTDVNGIITTFNKGAEKMLGYSSEEVVGKRTPEHFHSREQMQKRAKELEKQTGKKLSGFDVLIANTNIGQPNTREWIKVAKNGDKIPVLLTTSAITKNGKLTGYLGINTDLSQIKESEEKLKRVLNITVDQNKKLKNFAHIVSHNIRGHSANIQKLVDLIVAEQPEMKENKMLGMIKQVSIELRNVIDDLSYVTNIITDKKKETQTVDLVEILDEALESLNQKIENSEVEIINKLKDQKIVDVEKEYASNVIRSVIDNSITYRSKKRHSYVKIYLKENSHYFILHIEDNGIGFNMEKQERKLYNMYSKMHEDDKGAGLDLFISKYQMETMGGYIKIDSQIDVGTTVKLYFQKNEK